MTSGVLVHFAASEGQGMDFAVDFHCVFSGNFLCFSEAVRDEPYSTWEIETQMGLGNKLQDLS